MAEWLRRWTANPLGCSRVSSNLILVEMYIINDILSFLIKNRVSQSIWLKINLLCIFYSSRKRFSSKGQVCENIAKKSSVYHDEVAKGLRRCTANPLGCSSVTSSFILVEMYFINDILFILIKNRVSQSIWLKINLLCIFYSSLKRFLFIRPSLWKYSKKSSIYHDEVPEWLRRWTANPLGCSRVSSNLILVEMYFINDILFILIKNRVSQSIWLKINLLCIFYSSLKRFSSSGQVCENIAKKIVWIMTRWPSG